MYSNRKERLYELNGIDIDKIKISKSDTLLCTVDLDIFDLDEAQNINNDIKKAFPNNDTIVTFKGFDIEPLNKEELKCFKEYLEMLIMRADNQISKMEKESCY